MNNPPHSSNTAKPAHNALLLIFLAILAFITLIGIITFFGTVSSIPLARRQANLIPLLAVGILLLATLVCLFGVLQWRQWGVYGLATLSFISPVLELLLRTVDPTDWIAPFVQVGILYLLVRKRWDYFD